MALTCLFVRNFKSIINILAVRDEPDTDAVPRGGDCTWLVFNTAKSYDRICLACVVNKHEIFVLLGPEFLEVKTDFLSLRGLNFPRTILIVSIVVWKVGGLERTWRAVKNSATVWSLRQEAK